VFQLILFIAIAVLLLMLLLAAAFRGRAEGAAEALIGAQQALDSLQSELLSSELVNRIFAREDLEFVRAQAIPDAEELFLRERKRIALLWITRVREQLGLLRRLHLGSARYYARLSVTTELALAFDFAALLLECRLLETAFRLGGPFAAPRVAGKVAQLATHVCKVSRQSLECLAALEVEALPNSPTNDLGGA